MLLMCLLVPLIMGTSIFDIRIERSNDIFNVPIVHARKFLLILYCGEIFQFTSQHFL